VRPEAVDHAWLHMRGSVGMLLQLQEEPQLYNSYNYMLDSLIYIMLDHNFMYAK